MQNEEQIKSIVEQIKANLSIEELDDLERQYNEMLKRIKENEENKNKEEE